MATTRTAAGEWHGSLTEGSGRVTLESSGLTKAGHPPTTLNTRAEVDFQPGEGITGIRLRVSGDVPGLDADGFREAAEAAKVGCPVSKALAAVPITLTVD